MTTDADLLDRYAARRDAEAFAQLAERYQRMVFAACRRRLRVPADVDDAVQETFLRLARSGPRKNVGGWLHRCATNVSADLNRRRSTRGRHESAAARPEVDTDGSRELTELREHLDAALSRLDPPQRELVVQRFFVGRSHAELAATFGVTPSAVSHRLDRAVAALRGHLSTLGCGGAVVAGVVALLDDEQASAAVPPALTAKVASIGLGGLPRPTPAARWRSIGAAVSASFATVGLIVLALWLADHGTAATPAAPAPPAVGLTVAGGAGGLHEPPLPPQWHPAAPAAGPAPLSGRVTGKDGKPIANATVEAAGSEVKIVRTDADGRYALDDLPPGQYRVGADAVGYLPVAWNGEGAPMLLVTPGTQAVRDFVLEPGVVVTVHVTDAKGQPVINARVDTEVAVSTDLPITDANGQMVLTLPVSPTAATLMIGADGHAPGHATVTPAAVDRPQTVEATLADAMTVDGIALCDDGKPPVGWTVEPHPADWNDHHNPMPSQAYGKIGKDGSFRITDVGPGRYRLWVVPGPMMPIADAGIVTLPPAGGGPLRVTVPGPSPGSRPSLVGRLRFTGAGGVPWSLDVTAIGQGPDRYVAHQFIDVTRNGANTAEDVARDGMPFSIVDLPPDTYQLRWSAEEMDGKVLDGFRVPGPPVEITLEIGGKPHLVGLVTGPDGRPVAHYAVRIRKLQELGSGNNYGQDEQWQQVADDVGRFDVELSGPGIYKAQVSADGYAWAWSPDVRVEHAGVTANVLVKLSTGGTVGGKVTDAVGRPVVGARVAAVSAEADPTGTAAQFNGGAGAVCTDGAGRFTLAHLAAGAVALRVTNDQFAPMSVPSLTVTDGRATDAGTVRLQVGGGAEGTVYDGDGRPLAGAKVEFQDDEHYHYDAAERAAHLLAEATTDGSGHYAVAHLPPSVVVTAGLPESRAACVARRTIRPVDGRIAHLDFGGATVVSGRLQSSSGRAVGRAELTLSMGDASFGPVIAFAKSDADGRFAFHGVPPGAYTLYRADDESFNHEAKLRNVAVTGVGQDLGNIVEDRGAVVIAVSADDPADLGKLTEVSVERQHHDGWWDETVGFAGRDDLTKPTWQATGVPAGAMAVSLWLRDGNTAAVRCPFERLPGAATTTVAVHLPHHPPPPTTAPSDGLATVWLQAWSADGALVVDPEPPTVRDGAGPVSSATGRTEDGWEYRLTPGRHTVTFGRTSRSIDVTATLPNNVQPFDVVLER